MTWVRIHNVVATNKHLSLWCGRVRLLLLRKSKELSITNDNYRCLVRQVGFPFIIRSIERQREYPNKQQWQRIELLLHSCARCALLAHRINTDDHQGSLHKCTLKASTPKCFTLSPKRNFRCEHERERSGCVNSPWLSLVNMICLFNHTHTNTSADDPGPANHKSTELRGVASNWTIVSEYERELTLMMWAMQQSSHQSTEYGCFGDGNDDGIPKQQNETTLKSWLRDDILRKWCEWQYRLRKSDINRTHSLVGGWSDKCTGYDFLWLSSGLMESWGEL